MTEPTSLVEVLARMWIDCDPNRGGMDANEVAPTHLYSGGVGDDGAATVTATPNPLAGKPAWHWFIPRAEATIAYLAKHGLEVRGIPS